MSASQDKKKRAVVRSDENNPQQLALEKEAREKRRHRIRNIIIGAVAVVLLVAIIVVNSSLFYSVMPAVTIDGTKYTTAEFNYLYYGNYFSYVNQLGDYASLMGLDTSASLDSQSYPYGTDGETWADYFTDYTVAQLESLTMLKNEADAAGYTLSEDGAASVEEEIDYINYIYSLYGYSSANQYLVASYGRGSSEEVVREMLTLTYLCSEYYNLVYSSYEYTNDELDEYYAENADSLDQITYRSFLVSGDAEDSEDEAAVTAAMEAAKTTAEAFAADADSEETFADLAYEAASDTTKEYYEDPDYSLTTSSGSSLNTTYSEWLLDASRKTGDVEVFEGSTGYFVIMYVSRDSNDYLLRSVRHILVKAVADDDGEYTEEALATALESAEELYAEWQEGDADEDSFAALANESSEDGGSNTVGGLYEDIYKGQMVTEFNDFVFDSSRKYGDTGIVYGESSSSYAGYHIMFYVGEGDMTYAQTLADEELRDAAYAEWETAKLEGMTTTRNYSLKFAG